MFLTKFYGRTPIFVDKTVEKHMCLWINYTFVYEAGKRGGELRKRVITKFRILSKIQFQLLNVCRTICLFI